MNRDFDKQVRELAHLLVEHHGVLVFLTGAEQDVIPNSAWPANFRPYAKVHAVRVFPDGDAFYRLTPLDPVPGR